MKASLLQLGKPRVNQSVIGWYASEKLDGMRCYWDGGISRGVECNSVPWANPNETGFSTGLWSRYGHVIHALDTWIDGLPNIPLDGELWGDMKRQDLLSIVKRKEPDARWLNVSYCVFDSPGKIIASYRVVNEPNYSRVIDGSDWWRGRESMVRTIVEPYSAVYSWLQDQIVEGDNLRLLKQTTVTSVEQLDGMLEAVMAKPLGEGVMVRNPRSYYQVCRCQDLLKVKPCQDAEGVVVGYTPGLGKLDGMIGAVRLRLENGRILDLSGFTDAERAWDGVEGTVIRLGDKITFKYNGLSNAGIPQSPRYWRKYE